ncbi:MAG: acyl carrier protein [Saprospiraceae bacterium]|nr:acyl carrier protein [Saprospiraceae bacterium]
MTVLIRSKEEIEDWIRARVADHMGVDADQVDVNQEFLTFDVDSIVAFSLTGELVEWTGLELSPTLVWEHPTIEALSVYLSGELQQRTLLGH